ncbi:MAG: hypothetical protein H0V01_01880 [Bacteroidetes bacterium]|nr:hypothetical protein [Bacteroidota bacterium]HET6243292.1 hypothetical protein [Bacteroidia bacterium]
MKTTNISMYLVIGGLIIFPLLYIVYESGKAPKPVEVVEKQTIQKKAPTLEEMETIASSNPTSGNLIDLSVAYINNNMPEKSIMHLQKVIEMDPKSHIAYNNLCVAYTLLKQYDKGIEAGTKAIELSPDFQLGKNNLAWAKDEKKKLESTIGK